MEVYLKLNFDFFVSLLVKNKKYKPFKSSILFFFHSVDKHEGANVRKISKSKTRSVEGPENVGVRRLNNRVKRRCRGDFALESFR